MPLSSNVIKGKNTGQKIQLLGLSLPEFLKPVTATDATGFSPTSVSDFKPNSSTPPGEIAGTSSGTNTVPVSRPIVHSAVLRGGQAQSLVNGWCVPVLQGNVSHRVRTITSSNTEDLTRLISQAKTQSAEIIAEADEKATQILAETKTRAESLRQQAFMEGMNTAKSEAAQSMHQVERIFQETQLWQEQVMHQSQGRIMEMVIEIGRKLFGDGFELSAEQLDHVVSRAINEGSRLGNLRIYLHPEDAKILVNLWQESEITVNGQQIQIVSSQNISRGGCFVDGQFGIVDGRVEEQIDQIAESMKPVVYNLESDEV